MGAIKRWFDRRRRRIDIDILWKVCLQATDNPDIAKAAFYAHISNDPAWTEHFTEAELCKFVSDL